MLLNRNEEPVVLLTVIAVCYVLGRALAEML
jgi:hypothetical protein